MGFARLSVGGLGIMPCETRQARFCTGPNSRWGEAMSTDGQTRSTTVTARGVTSREAILAAAERLFSDKGYSATSMREISSAAGLKAGSLYAHIQSKHDLLYEIMLRIGARFEEMSGQAASMEGATASEKLRGFVRGHLGIVASHGDMANVLIMEWRTLEEDRREEIRQSRDRHEANLTQILEEGIASGEFGITDEKWARLVILSTVNWSGQWMSPDGPLSAEQIADRLFEVLSLGVSTRPVKARATTAARRPKKKGSAPKS